MFEKLKISSIDPKDSLFITKDPITHTKDSIFGHVGRKRLTLSAKAIESIAQRITTYRKWLLESLIIPRPKTRTFRDS